MRIVGGIASSIRITTPKHCDVRPVSDRAKASLFDSIGDFSGMKVADLFAGVGSFGLEAASRGAREVLFVEKDSKCGKAIKENIARVEKAGVKSKFTVLKTDVISCIPRIAIEMLPDFIFVDPPYSETNNVMRKLLLDEEIVTLAANALIIVKIPDKMHLDFIPQVATFAIKFRRNFAGTEFVFIESKT